MKSFTLLLLVVAFSFFTRAQVLTIIPSEHDLHITASEFTDAHSSLQNNSTTARTIQWIRYSDIEPSGWYTTVCDDNNCYAPSTSSMSVNIDANTTGLLKLNIFPNDVAGTAYYRILAYDVNDSANANAMMYIDITADPTTGIVQVNQEVISIYPNPVKDVLYINLDANKNINSIEIFNVVGQKFKTVNLQDGTKSIAIPLSDLKKGVYFIRVLSAGKEVATKTFSKD